MADVDFSITSAAPCPYLDMKTISKVIAALSVVVTLAVPSIASAEALAAKGTISSLETNTPSADAYLQYHGRMFVVTGSKGATSTAEYRWGGTSCGTRTLTEGQVAMLQRALESGTPITPRIQDGQGDVKCIVGFTIAP
jgi:hypothetical protein